MEVRELRAFAVIVDEGGMSAAARLLHVSQSALSQTVRSLERQLGTQVLTRDHTGARPTEAGELLLREARPLIAHYDQVVSAVVGPAGMTAGHLRIGVPLEFPVELLPNALAQLAWTQCWPSRNRSASSSPRHVRLSWPNPQVCTGLGPVATGRNCLASADRPADRATHLGRLANLSPGTRPRGADLDPRCHQLIVALAPTECSHH